MRHKIKLIPSFSDSAILWTSGIFIVILLSVCVYRPVTTMSFCAADDPWMLLSNPYANPKTYTFHYFYQVFTRINDIQYSPINTVIYGLIYKINAYDPYFFHLFNFFLHIVNGLLILILSRILLRSFSIPNSDIVAYGVFALWCLHPLNVEAVAWISGLKIVLCTFLTLLSFYTFILAFLKNNVYYYLISILTYLLSCFVKEQGIITPFMCLLFAICYRMKIHHDYKIGKSALLYVGLTISFSLLFGIFTMSTVNKLTQSNFIPMLSYPLWQRILLCVYCVRFYLINFFVPNNLHYHYPFPIRAYESLPFIYIIFAALLIAFSLFLIPLLRRSKDLLFYIMSGGIFFMQIALELQIIPMTRPAIVADRYMYLPSVGLLLICLHLGVNKLYPLLKGNKPKRFVGAVLVIYILYFASYSNQLVKNWSQYNIAKQ